MLDERPEVGLPLLPGQFSSRLRVELLHIADVVRQDPRTHEGSDLLVLDLDVVVLLIAFQEFQVVIFGPGEPTLVLIKEFVCRLGLSERA